MILSAKRIRELLDYDPLSGHLTWKLRKDDRGSFNAQFGGRKALEYIGTRGVSLRNDTREAIPGT